MIGPLSSSTAGRHRLHAGADVTRERGAGEPAIPPRKIGTPYGDLRRPTGPKANERNEPGCRVRVAGERFNAGRRRSERRRGAVSG